MDLSNNNLSMKTVVETFIVEEVEELIYDNEKLAEWNSYIDKLELAGQKKITKPEKSPNPFMYANESLVKVFEVLCPRKADVKDFDVTPIPVEILSLISLSVKEEYFNKIQIWYDEKTPDPVCVGITSGWYTYYECVPKEVREKSFDSIQEAKNAVLAIIPDFDFKQSWGWEANKKYYLLGKWADMKYSLDQLREKAVARYKKERKREFEQRIADAKKDLDSIENEVIRIFG